MWLGCSGINPTAIPSTCRIFCPELTPSCSTNCSDKTKRRQSWVKRDASILGRARQTRHCVRLVINRDTSWLAEVSHRLMRLAVAQRSSEKSPRWMERPPQRCWALKSVAVSCSNRAAKGPDVRRAQLRTGDGRTPLVAFLFG